MIHVVTTEADAPANEPSAADMAAIVDVSMIHCIHRKLSVTEFNAVLVNRVVAVLLRNPDELGIVYK